jgi:hypothetical protein
MRIRITHALIAAAALALVAAPAAAQNLVVNGGFEEPVVTNGARWDIYPSGTSGLGWTVEWFGGAGSYNGVTRPATANLELHRGVNGWLPYGGSEQYAELDSDWDGPGGGLNNEPASINISQDLTTQSGIYYVRYAYSPRPSHGDSELEVYWGGELVNSHDPGNPGGNTSWTTVELELPAAAGTTTLEFREVGTADSFGMFLDAVEVVFKEGCGQQEVALCAGQTMEVGTVTVGNDDQNLYVTFTIDEPGWFLEETHVAVATEPGDIPQTKKGTPIPGQFPYACDPIEPGATSCTATIPIGGWCAGQDLVVAAHAVVAEVMGDGCDQITYWANEVGPYDQGTLKNGGAVADDRSDPEAVFALDGVFYSLGFDLLDDGYADGFLTVGFGYPVYNGPGADIVAQEVTFGRNSYPLERAEVFGVSDGTDYLAGVVTNKDGGDGLGAVSLPASLFSVDAVKLLDATDPAIHAANGDGYDVDAIGACWLQTGDETAWAAACDGNGTQFDDKRGWATYFTYTVNRCAGECSGD